ncbi:MAG: DUF5606 domain-containing protein [Bacteroidia bacterium]|nr:DUF5606 domain-containing protein [Bacteroidia bacterium]
MSVSIKDVVSMTGAPGLYRILKADDKAIVIESMDDKKKRQLVKGSMMVSKLIDVSIYTDTESEPLALVLKSIREKYGDQLPVTKESGKDELYGFLGEVLPTFDRERVYPSNIKKLVSWYQILVENGVEFDWEPEAETADAESEEAESEEAEAESAEA